MATGSWLRTKFVRLELLDHDEVVIQRLFQNLDNKITDGLAFFASIVATRWQTKGSKHDIKRLTLPEGHENEPRLAVEVVTVYGDHKHPN